MWEVVRRLCRLLPGAAVAATILGAVSLPGPAEAFAVYTDRDEWLAALAGYTIVNETFENDISSAATITFDSGIVSTATPDDDSLSENQVNWFRYLGVVDGGGFDATFDTITWTFPVPIIGFGMYLIEAASADVLTITGNFDGTGDQTVNVGDYLPDRGYGFLGIIGTAPFTTITFDDADASDVYETEAFALRDLAFAPAPVPEPATLALFGAGLAGLGLIARRRKSVATAV